MGSLKGAVDKRNGRAEGSPRKGDTSPRKPTAPKWW